ncbi:MAG: DarT ssDNA thymidine ADP-ribosyltransferase family protein [Lachnospiraceae bacterium]|nr:DarT ssDNA thymidine ADP-ribosyltransferase family protein [Lachnospiraceae bacterium]
MKIPEEYQGRYFYHFTHADNIDSIVRNGLLSTNVKLKLGICHHNIANPNIQERRSEMSVDVGPGGVVHDYVPFYFTSKNPMLLSLLYSKNVDQQLIVFMAISIDKIMNDNVIFTDASANTTIPPHFYDNPNDLDKVHWELIDSNKVAHLDNDDKHFKMAEVLIYRRVPIDWIDSYIVWNKVSKKIIKKSYKGIGLEPPTISYEPFRNKYFYFTKFCFKGRETESLVTGPVFLKREYYDAIEEIIGKRESGSWENAKFIDIEDAVEKLKDNFSILPELNGIENLETDNNVHHQTVSEHTLLVVDNVDVSVFYNHLGEHDKAIVELSAFLHDIGKGPKNKWKDGVQKVYPDHPADAIPMLIRILSEEFRILDYDEIQKICVLVVYHDLLGDILINGRNKQELIDLKLDNDTLTMLAVLSAADIYAINQMWYFNYINGIQPLLNEIMRW